MSQLQGGEPIPQDAGRRDEFIRIPAISNDGSHILMSTTRWRRRRQSLHAGRTTPSPMKSSKGNGVQLIGMSSDGSKVAFISPKALTSEDEDSSSDIYMWEESNRRSETGLRRAGARAKATTATRTGPRPATFSCCTSERPDIDDRMSRGRRRRTSCRRSSWTRKIRASRTRETSTTSANGQVQYVTTLDPGTTTNRLADLGGRPARRIPDPVAADRLRQPYYDNSEGNLKHAAEMYVFDAATGEIQCASCNPTG